MRTTPFALALLAAMSARIADAQDNPPAPPAETDKPSANDAAAAYVDEIKGKLSKLDEASARAAVARLLEIWKDKDVLPETKKPVPDLLVRCANGDKVAVAVAAIDALAELPPEEGGKALREVLERVLKEKTPSVDLYGACLRGLKKVADPSKGTTDLLVNLLQRKENDVVAKAADAIAGYKDAPGKVRRDLMEEVIKVAESAFSKQQGGKDSAAVAKWGAIQGGVMSALRALSKQNFGDPTEARAWFNEHKKDAKSWT